MRGDLGPPDQRGFLFDLDGTVTEEEILPVIAREAGLEEEIRLLTDLTVSGAIPFAVSFRLRVALLRDVPLDRIHAAVRGVPLNRQLLDVIGRHPDRCAIVTGNLDLWIQPLIEMIPCRVLSSTGSIAPSGACQVDSIMDKGHAVAALRQQYGGIVAVGDGANDVPMFRAADFGIAYGGVHRPAPMLVEVADMVCLESGSLCRLLNMLL